MGILDKFKKLKPSAKGRSASGGEEKLKKVPASKEKITNEKKPEPVKEQTEKKVAKATDETKKPKDIKYQGAYRVLIKPVVSEKATMLTSQNSYVFEVAPKMNKIEIKKAVQKVYNVTPIKVNIINVIGRNVRYGKTSGKTKSWKKAIVTLKDGDTIQLYEGV
ncbi:50S ribosomal protein L23 [Patescibacteria group bacterium]|nr:50S ribosomal protein L23 [Patescibacteria group bacterium]